MNEKVELRGTEAYWNKESNKFYHKVVHKTVKVTVPWKLLLLKIYLIIASVGVVGCWFFAAVLSEANISETAITILGVTGCVLLPTLYLWFTYYIKVEHLADGIQQAWDEELALESSKLQEECNLWREQHPLEEQCRKALEKNPNEVAQLIRMLQEAHCGRD